MDYGSLISDAWRMTWRHRFLWVFGLFGGGVSGVSFGNGGGDISSPDAVFTEIGRWLADHLWLVLLGVLLLVAIGLVCFVIAFIAQGGLTGATVDLGSGRRSSFQAGLRAGVRLFWRYVGLWLLLVAAGLVVLTGVGALVGAAVLLTMVVEQKVWVIIPSVLIGMMLLLAMILCGAVVSVVVMFAKRAIADQDLGPVAALRDGWRLVRFRPGTTFLVWLLDVALSFGASIAVAIIAVAVLLILAVPLLPVLIGRFSLNLDLSNMMYPAIAYGVFAGGLWFALLLFLSALINTFQWSYWTLAYLRLREQMDGALAPAAAP